MSSIQDRDTNVQNATLLFKMQKTIFPNSGLLNEILSMQLLALFVFIFTKQVWVQWPGKAI